jgi:hypothetical protein
MKINNNLVKHYIQYDISSLSVGERQQLSIEINNEQVLNPLAHGIIKQDETPNSKWLVSFTRSLNDVSIRNILKINL